MIVLLGLVMHGLVAMTGTLGLAMAVHLAYDLTAGAGSRRKALEYDRLEARATRATRAARS